VPLMGLAVLIGWRRRALREAADPSRRRRRRAYRFALDRIDPTRRDGAGTVTTRDVAQALLRFYSDRYNRSAHGQLRADILATLQDDGVDAPLAEEYLALLDECDRSRYTPGDSDGASPELIARTREVLSRIERAK
ncbi:MAG TPA: hypothetical protein VM118_00855, partial [Acidobacteriota bacterium]|nr:hypothetical protein [Acidobacteriota bacterium]